MTVPSSDSSVLLGLSFRTEAFQFAVDNGYDHPDYTDWVYSGVNTNKQGAVSATAATAGDNEWV